MQSLRATALALRRCGRQAAFYLAAAVSDFYIPWHDMVSLAPLHGGERRSAVAVDQQWGMHEAGLRCNCGPAVGHA